MPRHDWKALEPMLRHAIEVELLRHTDCARIFGSTPKQIHRACKRLGILCQRTGPRSGPGHPDWKGGRIVDKDGYILVYSPEHSTRKHTRHVLEHRLVMARHLGRELLPSEVVHHRNGNKQDNRIENLEVFETNGEHLKATLRGKPHNVSPEGRERIRAAVRARNASRKASRPDAPPRP